MNIAVFTKATTFHKGHGGMETQNKVLCEGLAQKGHKIVVFSPLRGVNAVNTNNSSELEENSVKYVFIDCSYRYFLSSINKNSWYNRSYDVFSKFHINYKFDLILGQSSAAIGLISRRDLHQVPVVSVSHGTTLGELKTQLNNVRNIKDILRLLKNSQYVLRQFFGRQRDFILRSNHVIAVSQAVKNNLIDETYIPAERITVVNNGIDPTQFMTVRSGRALEGKGVLYVGQLTQDKGIAYLIDTFLTPAFENYILYVAGDGPLKNTLESKISEDPNGSRIKLLGKIPYSQIVDYYLNPDISAFVFPTRREEGLPMVLVEAMFSGLPVVAFNKGGVGDIVKNEETGYLVNPGDDAEFSEKLLEMLNDANILHEFSKNALKYAYSALTLSVMIEKYEEVFMKVTKK